MAKLYCYHFDGMRILEKEVEVTETEKQYRTTEGDIPFTYKSKINKSELGVQYRIGYTRSRTYVYITDTPNKASALECFQSITNDNIRNWTQSLENARNISSQLDKAATDFLKE